MGSESISIFSSILDAFFGGLFFGGPRKPFSIFSGGLWRPLGNLEALLGGWKILLGSFLRAQNMKMPIGGPKNVQNEIGTPGGPQEALESALAPILDRF